MIACYLNLFSGVSGDMLLSAFLDAGLPLKFITDNIKKILNEKEFQIDVIPFQSYGLTGKQINIWEKPIKCRNLVEIKKLVNNSKLSENIKKITIKTFEILGSAEAKIHNIPLENVHFHEIGAVDTIIDIVGVVSAIEYFKIEKIFISSIPVGEGEIDCQHGKYPNPAPATVEILRTFKVEKIPVKAEITTPTGVAILKGIGAIQTDSFSFKISKTGYGFGKKRIENRPNCLQVIIGELVNEIFENSYIYEIEFNIDDMTGEQIGYFIENIFKFNIVDIQCISTITKKNRPGYIFKILSKELDFNLIKFIFQYSTTSGIRYSKRERIILERFFNIENLNGKSVKNKIYKSSILDITKSKLEFDDVIKKGSK